MNYLHITRQWLEGFVIALNLCPFAAVPFRKEQIRYVLADTASEVELMQTFLTESERLLHSEPQETETTLIVHPNVLQDFLDYNDFLGLLDELLEETGLRGVLQVASFHPAYQFEGVSVEDPANYTNRSPFPMLHLLREESVARAVDQFPDPERIPERNIQRLRSMEIGEILSCWKENKSPH